MFKVIAFDMFGTVLDVSQVPLAEKREYIKQVRTLPWEPLKLPKTWLDIPAHADAAEGLRQLRTKFDVVTCSNLPIPLTMELAGRNKLVFDDFIDIAERRVYKPNIEAYKLICEVMHVNPDEVLMITGNEGSPDLTAPKAIGMATRRIRGEDGATIIDLANELCR